MALPPIKHSFEPFQAPLMKILEDSPVRNSMSIFMNDSMKVILSQLFSLIAAIAIEE